MTPAWAVASAAAGALAGPRIRSCVFSRTAESGQPPRHACPGCAQPILSGRRGWRSLLPVTGRCPACRARIGPYPLVAEFTAGLAMAVVAVRASSAWELAALAWLVSLAVPLAFIDSAVRRLPNPLTAASFTGALALLAVDALAGHQPGHLTRAIAGAVILAGFYLLPWLIRPGGMGLGDVKLAASVGLALAWISWQAVFAGTFLAFVLAACYAAGLLVTRKASRGSPLPLGPFMLVGALAAIAFLPVGSHFLCLFPISHVPCLAHRGHESGTSACRCGRRYPWWFPGGQAWWFPGGQGGSEGTRVSPHAVSGWRTWATGCRVPIRAGTMVSAAIAASVPSAAAASQVADGRVPPWTAALNRTSPSGIPRMAPGSAGMTWATTSPETTCRVRARVFRRGPFPGRDRERAGLEVLLGERLGVTGVRELEGS